MTGDEKKLYKSLGNSHEVEGFQRAFWTGKSLTESEYMARIAHADNTFGSGQTGSGANTDQGRFYIANGAPNSVHRLPSSRIFVATEVWYYDSLPRTGYRSRLQFLFFKKNGAGDFRLFSPGLNSIRDLLIPQPGTRLMFPVNDVITANDIQDRLKYSPAEFEIVDAAIGVARGITGAGNGEILARAASISHMIRTDRDGVLPGTRVESTFATVAAPEVRVLQFMAAGGMPVVDVQVRVEAVGYAGLTVEENGRVMEQSQVPIGRDHKGSALYVQRFFLLPGAYRLKVDADGRKSAVAFQVYASVDGVRGEAFEERPGELKIAITPDPRDAGARETWARQAEGRLRASVPGRSNE